MLEKQKIIFVHGLASKPSEDDTHKLWKKCLIESLKVTNPDVFNGVSKSEINNIFQSAYWANAVPSHIEDDDEYVKKLKTCVNRVIKERKEKGNDFHVGLGAKFKAFFKDRGLDIADIFVSALTIKDDVAETFLEEVKLYINDQYIADKMRDPLECALRDAWDENKDVTIISHSMGTFIAYDVLWRFSHRSTTGYKEYRGKKVNYLVTMGSPLGNGVIKDLLFASRYEDGNRRYPINVEKWHNFSCLGDIVSHDSDLNDDFMANMKSLGLLPKGAKDYVKLYNPFKTPSDKVNPHKSYGYLVQPKLAEKIEDILNK